MMPQLKYRRACTWRYVFKYHRAIHSQVSPYVHLPICAQVSLCSTPDPRRAAPQCDSVLTECAGYQVAPRPLCHILQEMTRHPLVPPSAPLHLHAQPPQGAPHVQVCMHPLAYSASPPVEPRSSWTTIALK